MFKNVSGQKLKLLAIDSATGLQKSGDASNITAYVNKDNGGVTVLGDTSATEDDATNAKGIYTFDLTQAETNADELCFTGKSTTSGIVIVPRIVYTLPQYFSTLGITSAGKVSEVVLTDTLTTYTGNTVQTGDSYAVVNSATFGNAKLVRSTTPANTLDVSATGEAGLDWANIGSPTTTVDLSGTTIKGIDSVTFPTHFSSLAIDASGRIDVGDWLGNAVTVDANSTPNVSAKYLAGTSLTGRDIGASVLLSAGSGTGQLDFTSGVVKANLAQILGTALTETAGQIAAAFKKFFNVATPASTMDALTLVATATNLTNAGPDTSGTTTLLGRLTSTRAGLLDNLDAAVSTRMATYTQPTGFLAATFPSGTVANTTNITAGTITTTTNLTNAPTTGDFTAAMKSSLDAATPVISGLTAAALKNFFDTDSTTTYSSAVSGSVVKEIADNAGGSSITVPQIVDGVLDELLSGHTTPGSVAVAISAAGSAGDPWISDLSTYSSGQAGYLVYTNLDAAVSTRLPTSSYTAPPTATAIATTIFQDTTGSDFSVLGSAGYKIFNFLDTNVGSRAPSATALSNTTWTNSMLSAPGVFAAAALANLPAVTLATSQPNYAPAKAGDAMTLTSAYDAAKSAASQTSVNAIPTNPLTSLGTNAPTGWINAAAIASAALNGKGDWNTTTPPTSATIAAAVRDVSNSSPAGGSLGAAVNAAADPWTIDISTGYSGGQAGAKLNAAGAAGDPLASTVPGSYAEGTAGFAIGTYLDAPVSGAGADHYIQARIYGAAGSLDSQGRQVFYSPPNAEDGGNVAKVRLGPTNPRGGRTVELDPDV